MRTIVTAVGLLLFLGPAWAQDADPAAERLDAQEALRDRQMEQLEGALARAAGPLQREAAAAAAASDADEPETSSSLPLTPLRAGPWVLGGLAVLAAGVFVVVLRRGSSDS